MKARLIGSTVVVLALAAGCSSDSREVNLQDGSGAEGGEPSSTGGANSDTGGATSDAGASAQLGGASSGGSRTGGALASGGTESGGSGNASTGGQTGGMSGTGGARSGGTGGVATGGAVTGGVPIGGIATGGVATGGFGAVLTGGSGGIVCDPPCVVVCKGGLCDCACPNTGGMGGAGTGGAETGGVVTGGGPTGGGPTGGAGGAPGTCGGIECGPNEECCGPPECGYCIPIGTDPACSGSCTRRPCGNEGLECLDPVLGYPGEVCVERLLTAGPTSTAGYECVRHPCGTQPLDCTCAMPVCEDGVQGEPICVSADPDTLMLVCEDFRGICNSPDTPIATPQGERAIATLREGDLVYSVHDGAIVAVPLVWATRTPVFQHCVVRLELDSGAVLEISAPHPTADGRTLGGLQAGDTVDDAKVVSTERVPYRFEHTYDILPASDTGTYFAGGVRLGSTLAAAR